MKTSNEAVTTWPNRVFSVTCSAIPTLDGRRLPFDITLEWKRIAVSPTGIESETIMKTSTHKNRHKATSALTTTENDMVNDNITYICTAIVRKVSNTSYVNISVIPGMIYRMYVATTHILLLTPAKLGMPIYPQLHYMQ